MPRFRYWLCAALVTVIGLTATSTAQDAKDKTEGKEKTDAKAKDAPAPAPSGDKVELKWKFEKDKPFYQAMTTTTQQEMKVMGMEVKQTQEQTFDFSWTVKEEDKDKNTVVVQKIEGVKLKIDIAGNPITYDSANPTNANNALADFFKALVGTEFKLTIDKNMKVVRVEGREEFLRKLTSANQQMEPLLKKILSEDAVKQMADPTFGIVPSDPVAKGGTWKREGKLNLGPIGSYKTNETFTLEGTEKEMAKIKVDTNLTYEPPTEGGEGLPFKIKEAKLTSKNPKGSAQFDTVKGRLDSSNKELELEGTLDIEIGGIATKVELKQKQTTTVKTSDTAPKKS